MCIIVNNGQKNTYVKEQLTDAMLRLLEEERLEALSIRDLCQRAGVGRASFYRNYRKKEDIVREYAGGLILQWGKAFESDPASGPFNVFASLFAHVREHEKFYILLCRQGLSYLMLDTIKEKVGLLPNLSNQDAYRKAFFAYGLYGWILEWIQRGMAESPEEINRLLFQNAADH